MMIERVDVRTADDAFLEAYCEHQKVIRTERLPDDPPLSVSEIKTRFENIPSMVTLDFWVAREEGDTAVVGAADLVTVDTDDNRHIGQMNIEILPAYRRKGLGTQLLRHIVDTAKAANRRLLITGSNGHIPSGQHFLEKVGGQKGLEAHTNQLTMAELDYSIVEEWLARAETHATGFELGFWDGPYPEEEMDAIVKLNQVMNQQPMGDLEVEDFNWTPEQIRQIEQMVFAGGRERWTYYVREKSTGEFAGFTDVVWNPNRPEKLEQGNTGVFPQYRRRGLGRWLKAAMLQKVINERPEVKFVRTGNADANAPMLKINNELGFKPYLAETVWQIPISEAENYLAG